MRSFRSVIFPLAAALLLSGCPFPVPPHYQATRENLEDRVPSFIKAGETTREDVLMVMGEPDAVAIDDTWIEYGSAYSQGGVGFVMAAGNTAGGVLVQAVRYRRLVIRFDARGIVAFTEMESRTCPGYAGAIGDKSGESYPCLDIWGLDIPNRYKWPDRRPDTIQP
jgi:outer membrane protein assembly factor BamE (lipoprotein component of BamABCDE complex)